MNFQGYFVNGMRTAAKRQKSLRANSLWVWATAGKQNTESEIDYMGLSSLNRKTEELAKSSEIKLTC